MKSTDFIDNSNQRAKERRWCLVHPTGFWGKDLNGDWYTRCSYGNKLNENCKVGEDLVSER